VSDTQDKPEAANGHSNESSNPPAEKPKAHKAERARAQKKTRRTGALLSVIFILLAVMAGTGWYGYQYYEQTQQTLSYIEQSQSALTEQAQGFEDGVLKKLAAMQAQQKDMTDYIEALREKDNLLRKDWLLMEAEYLIQLANYRLLFERDINTAMVALESADARLRETGDPAILSVRKVIAEAVQSLKQIPQADLAGLSLQLSALNKNIDKLPLAIPDPVSNQQKAEQEQVGQHVDSWTELPSAIWRDLKSLIVITDHDAPIEPMLAPKERFFLIENIRLQLEQARLAMLSGQAAVYQERITTTIAWIKEHFDKDAQVTVATLATLNDLAKQSIAPELPDISNTYQAIQKYRLRDQQKNPAKTDALPAGEKAN
jgi:uroporphyrin-3 C-methyltransferase